VQEALDAAARGRTTLTIAHRLSTVIGADVIHVVDAGRIVESGTHASLIAQDGLYTDLAAQQLAASRVLEVEATEPPGALPGRRADRAPEDPPPVPFDDPVVALTGSLALTGPLTVLGDDPVDDDRV
jgi:ATP-binding cassette subfamily B protein